MNCMSYLRFLFWLEYQDCTAREWSYFNFLSPKSKNSWLKLEMITHDHNSSFGFEFYEKCGKLPPDQGLLLRTCIHVYNANVNLYQKDLEISSSLRQV